MPLLFHQQSCFDQFGPCRLASGSIIIYPSLSGSGQNSQNQRIFLLGSLGAVSCRLAQITGRWVGQSQLADGEDLGVTLIRRLVFGVCGGTARFEYATQSTDSPTAPAGGISNKH
ncbi:MAG: hypothetical protein J07HX5_00106 [halophilic archaeon J07HX5]|nr:MAG: hypothetical protein J07HX5_00106 [halophilic archaeon J07HX5]